VRDLGFSRRKAEVLVDLSQRVACGDLDLEALERADDNTAVAALRSLHGIGRWSAEYVLLRGLGRIGVFPGDDVGARNNLRRWLGPETAADYDGVARAVSRWAPFAGLVYFHLLLDGIDRRGLLADSR
jgi:DNA-3-methyladenine glycosylase II